MSFNQGSPFARSKRLNSDPLIGNGGRKDEITIIDGFSGEILIRGGRFFRELTAANLAGATAGGCICKLRGIYEGFPMELTANGKRTVTSPVESIGILV